MDSVASSSSFPGPAASSSLSSRRTYDVFLSFRGADTRHNFTHNLYNELVRRGIYTFKDDDELSKGKEIAQQLPKAIQESRIAIVILSENYGNSRWCLDELAEIVECMDTRGQLVLPVFCGVDPSHVRKQSGTFEGAFAEHEVRYAGKVEKWRSALTRVGSLSGWDLQTFANRNEAQVINEIIEVVAIRVKHTFLHVAKYPVRLDYHERELYSLLGTRGEGGVTFVGISGMGGIGKTTIAKHFYNSAFGRYEGSCFLANVREGSRQPNGMVQLQKELLSQLMMKNIVEVPNLDRGISLLDQRLRNRRVLNVLDDVDTREQLNSLAGDRSSFGKGSLVIVTTRNEQLLDQLKVDLKYEVGILDEVDSLELFSWHAFHKPVPPPSFLNISEEFVKHAGGLPLALEVLGSSLVDENHAYWESMINKLKVIPQHEIQEKLKISFDALNDYTQKEIFLDIACFFVGMEKTRAVTIFDGCGFFGEAGITTLVRRSLLKIPYSNILEMHDLVRDMGKEIVRGRSPKMPGKQSRVWLQNDVLDILRNDKGTEEVEGMVLDLSMQEHFSTKPFAKMPNLRLLKLENVNLIGDFEGFSKELRWLSWRGCPLESIPTNLHLEKLVDLDMAYSGLRFLWNGEKWLGNLKLLDVSGSELLTTTPNFSRVRNLEELKLYLCKNLSSIDPSIGLLDNLTTLNLSGCCNLKNLPEEVGSMKGLAILNASETGIEELPDSIGLLDKLITLNLDGCSKLKCLPSTIGLLKSLEELNVRECSNLEGFPEALGDIQCLKEIEASKSGIRGLPQSLWNLCQLQTLWLYSCESLRSLPNNIGNMTSLMTLHLSYCSNLERLPDNLHVLSGLIELNLDFCSSLQSVPDLPPNLRNLFANNCWSLENLPDISNFKWGFIELVNCHRLVEIQGLEILSSQGNGEYYELYLPRLAIPDCFEHQGIGESVISLYVPHTSPSITLWLDCDQDSSTGDDGMSTTFEGNLCVGIRNQKTGFKMEFTDLRDVWEDFEVVSCSWVIHYPFDNEVKGGDSIEVSFVAEESSENYWKVGKWGVHLGHYKSEEDNLLNPTLSLTKDGAPKRSLDVNTAETSCKKTRQSDDN